MQWNFADRSKTDCGIRGEAFVRNNVVLAAQIGRLHSELR
jgi:hypothetical protein